MKINFFVVQSRHTYKDIIYPQLRDQIIDPLIILRGGF